MQKIDPVNLLQFLNVIFGSKDRAAHSDFILAPDGTRWIVVFNADSDHICTLHIDQARWLFYSLSGDPAEYWRSMSILAYGRIPYEPTEEDYDDLAKLYGMTS